MLMHADDTVIYFSDNSIESIQNNLQKDFDSLSRYFYSNELIMNLKKGKTELMLFGTDQRIRRLDNSKITIQHDYHTINMTKSYKYLGISLTSSLNMTDHLNATIKKASSRIHLLRRMRNHMDSKTAKLIYQTMIAPILTYCPLAIYGSIPSYLKTRINSLENRVQFIIGNEMITCSETISKKRFCVFVHKCLHTKEFEDYFGDYFKCKKTKVNTRDNGTKVVMPRIKLETARKSAFYQGAKIFNLLPIEYRSMKDLDSFKKLLDDFF